MPVYMDVHRNVTDTSPENVEQAHLSDLEAQDRHGVRYLKYWVNRDAGTIFCLVEGPSPEACEAVHREAHGLMADEIIEVEAPLVEAFLGGPETELGAALTPDGGPDGAFRALLCTELDAYSAIAQRSGEAAAIDALREHDERVREALAAHDGREVQHTGDGILASFTSTALAIECAIAVQRALVARVDEAPIDVRIGVSAGEPVERGDQLFGVSVQLARRLCDAAESGQILVSEAVRELSLGKGCEFVHQGEARLRGFEQPVTLYEVRWQEESTPVTSEPGRIARRLAAILSADAVGYSRLMAENELATVRTLTAHREDITRLVRAQRGRIVDAPGDNVLAEFASATDAVQCAVEIQSEFEVRNALLSPARRMSFRIGIHLGEVTVEGARIYGGGVNIAARLEGLAEPGAICISGMVHEQVEGKLDLSFEDAGEQTVKNIPRAVRVYRIAPVG